MARKKGINRREFLKGVAGAAAVAGVGPAFFPKKASAQKATLTIWHTESSAVSVKAVQKVADRFEEMHPGVKVEQQGIGWASLGPKLTTSIAAGTPPDIAQMMPHIYISMVKRGLLVPLDDVYKALGEDNIFETVKDLADLDGHRWGISHEVGCPVILVRKDLAEKAGYKVPVGLTEPMFKTWDEQIEYLKAATNPKKRQWGMSLPGSGYFLQEHAGRWVGSNGGSFYDKKWNPAFHTDPFVGVLEFIKRLSDEKVVPPDWLSQSWLGMIVEICTGKATLIDHGYGRIAASIDKYAPGKESEDYFYSVWRTPGPLGDKAYTDLDGELWTVFKKSKNQDLAKEFIKLFYEKDLYLNYISAYPVHMFPITKSLANDPSYKALPALKTWKRWISQQEEYIKRGQALPVGVYAPHEKEVPFIQSVYDSGIIVDEIMSVVQGRRKPKQAGEMMTKRVNALIKELGYPVPDPIRAKKKA
jgi:N,N'-diacetylchitobiose transport system substrate-binding protein